MSEPPDEPCEETNEAFKAWWWAAPEFFHSDYELARMAFEAGQADALSTQDQAQGGRPRSAHSQPPGAQVDPAASAPIDQSIP